MLFGIAWNFDLALYYFMQAGSQMQAKAEGAKESLKDAIGMNK